MFLQNHFKMSTLNETKMINNTLHPCRLETRYHLIDLHSLANFIKRETMCLACQQTNCLSMMGNISRQIPPTVTKMILKCQKCSFSSSQDIPIVHEKKNKSSNDDDDSCFKAPYPPKQTTEHRKVHKQIQVTEDILNPPAMEIEIKVEPTEIWVKEEPIDLDLLNTTEEKDFTQGKH